jgi:hypothetical protein
MASKKKDDEIFKNVTRYTTPSEREQIKGIEIDARDLDEFMDKMRKGMIAAADAHKHAVQDNFAMRVEGTVRLSRPVYDSTSDQVDELVGLGKVNGQVSAVKAYKKPGAQVSANPTKTKTSKGPSRKSK